MELRQTSRLEMVRILRIFGYSVDEDGFVIETNTLKRVNDKYTNRPVSIDHCNILPSKEGTPVIIDGSTPFSFIFYFDEMEDDTNVR